MDRKHNKNLVGNAKNLRKNMTKEEKHLWYDFLREYPVRFIRQKILGKYIVDFYCAKAKLVIELDGSQHYSEEGESYDAERTEYLEKFGVKILRFSNYEFNRNFEGVCTKIDFEVRQSLSLTTFDSSLW